MASDNQVFVGAIEYNLDKETLEDEVYKWDGVQSVYYKGPTSGWANVSFVNREKRDKFLADKSKHRSVKILTLKGPSTRRKLSLRRLQNLCVIHMCYAR